VGIEIDCDPLKGPNTTFWELKKNNVNVGKITSAVYSPRLRKNIALAMITIDQSEIGNQLQVTTNEGTFNCVVVEKPFYDPKKKIASS
jgi:aminomethyltransferase